MIDIRDFACPGPSSTSLGSPATFVQRAESGNPIEGFLATRLEIVTAGSAPLLTRHPIIGRLLLLASVSAFEDFCRGILAGCLALCPISQAKSSDKNVSLGGAIWHGPRGDFSRSAFEHKSLADSRELKAVFRDYVGFSLDDPIFGDLLENFEKIMQLRHAVVHSNGVLPGRNAVKLEIGRDESSLVVVLGQSQVQECLLVLSNLSVTINRELFLAVCHRWAIEWRRRDDWRPEREDRILRSIFELFVNREYNSALPNRKKWRNAALKDALYRKYSL